MFIFTVFTANPLAHKNSQTVGGGGGGGGGGGSWPLLHPLKDPATQLMLPSLTPILSPLE